MTRRIRTIKPELIEDERIAGLSHEAFRLCISLITMADDYGNLRAHPQKLESQTFWLQKNKTPIRDLLAELVRAELVVFYVARSQHYIHISNWAKHQRVDKPGKPLLPGPDDPESIIVPNRESPREASRDSQESSRDSRECSRDFRETSSGPFLPNLEAGVCLESEQPNEPVQKIDTEDKHEQIPNGSDTREHSRGFARVSRTFLEGSGSGSGSGPGSGSVPGYISLPPTDPGNGRADPGNGAQVSGNEPAAPRRQRKPKAPAEPLAFSITALLAVLAEASKGAIVTEPFDQGLAASVTRTIRAMMAAKLTLEDARLAAEWIAEGGDSWRDHTVSWVSTTGALIGAIGQARKWNAEGRPSPGRNTTGHVGYRKLEHLPGNYPPPGDTEI